MNLDFLLQQTSQYDTSINLFCLVLLTLECLFIVLFFTNDKTFALFLYEVKPNNFIPNGEIFFETIYYIVFDFIVLSD